jgi:hypothetical protein
MGNPKLLCMLLLGSIALSASLKCYEYTYHEVSEDPEPVVQSALPGSVCFRVTYPCTTCKGTEAPCTPAGDPDCTDEDVASQRAVTVAGAVPKSDYLAGAKKLFCSRGTSGAMVLLRAGFEASSCQKNRCNKIGSTMKPYLCETEVSKVRETSLFNPRFFYVMYLLGFCLQPGVSPSADEDSSDEDSSDGEDRRLDRGLLQLLEQKVASATENANRVLRAL